ncbi:HalOD1 output domain-containing protein [Halorarum halophilum]|nr:HalOD1 output domain-containing protein [Halobaculum halophilum]
MDDRHNSSRPVEEIDGLSADESVNEAPDGGWAFEAQIQYDPSDPRDLTTVIITGIAEAEGVSITEVTSPPLYEVVDIVAIDDALFGRPNASREDTDSAFEFRYHEYKVRVEADGWVTVLRPSDGPTTE